MIPRRSARKNSTRRPCARWRRSQAANISSPADREGLAGIYAELDRIETRRDQSHQPSPAHRICSTGRCWWRCCCRSWTRRRSCLQHTRAVHRRPGSGIGARQSAHRQTGGGEHECKCFPTSISSAPGGCCWLPLVIGLWWLWQRRSDPLRGWREQMDPDLLEALVGRCVSR